MIRALSIALFTPVMAVHANRVSASHIRAGIGGFNSAYRAWNADGFTKAAGNFLAATMADPHSARVPEPPAPDSRNSPTPD